MGKEITSKFKKRLEYLILNEQKIIVQDEFNRAENNYFAALSKYNGLKKNDLIKNELYELHREAEMWDEMSLSRQVLLTTLKHSYEKIYEPISVEELENRFLPPIPIPLPKVKKKRERRRNKIRDRI
jgi:hypothetical protein